MSDIDQLLREIKDQDIQISHSAAKTLVRSGDERALPYLLDYIADESRRDRAGVVFNFSRFPADLVLEPLLRCLSEEDWGMRDAAFFACLKLKETRAIRAIIELLKALARGEEETWPDGAVNEYTTYVFIRLIGNMCEAVGDPSLFRDAVEPLRHFLTDPREKARQNAAKSLMDLGEIL